MADCCYLNNPLLEIFIQIRSKINNNRDDFDVEKKKIENEKEQKQKQISIKRKKIFFSFVLQNPFKCNVLKMRTKFKRK